MRPVFLPDLEAFAAVARHRSFRRAAIEREVSPSLLSQTVSRLEEQLGVRLLNRTTRSVSPTQAGEELLSRLAPAFITISEALEHINDFRASASGLLRLNAPRPVAHLMLAPMLAEFLQAHPGISLEIVAEDAFVDMVAEGFDAGIRFGESLARDMIAVPLGPPQRMIVVVAPSYLEISGCPKEPSDLVGKSLIRHRFPGGTVYPWEFERNGQEVVIAPSGPLSVNDPHVKLQAAIDGAGFAFEFEAYARPALDQGRLVTVLDDWCPTFPGPYLYYSSRRHMPTSLRAFIDFAKQRFSCSQTTTAACRP